MSGARLPRTAQRLRGALRRLPLRVRLVAGFVVAITLVLAGAGGFVYWRVSYALDLRLNNDLRAEAAALAPLVTAGGGLRADPGLDRLPGVRRYQVLDARGAVLSAGTDVRGQSLLSPRQARAALDGPLFADVGALLPISRRPLRLFAVPLSGIGPARALVVAERRDERDEALRELLAQLLVAGVGALIVSSVVGERLAKAALAPVERYRSQAVSIAAGATGLRLDVPDDRDDEVTRLGHTLNEVLDALEHALDRERQFTQDASHELRTPLTLLSTRVQLALQRPRSGSEYESTLRELGQDVATLAALADQLLRISTSDALSLTATSGCDLAAVTDEVIAEYAGSRGGHGASISPVTHSDGRRQPLRVAMPEPQVRQVLTNLVENALIHGGGCVDVHVGATDGAARLTVSDAGMGVDRAFLPSAANRFARAVAARGRPGVGLGLSLVRALVERYDGELRFCSAGTHHRYSARFACSCVHAQGGTTATVLLPLQP